jgi:hypothetical protein
MKDCDHEEQIEHEYQHEIICSGDRRQPVGSPGCSCRLGKLFRKYKQEQNKEINDRSQTDSDR